jgi:HK97 family phage prohead protease
MSEQIYFASTATVTDQRTFEGIAAPYGKVTRDDRKIQFSAGAFGNVEDLALAAVMIQHPFNAGAAAVRIGRVTEWKDTPEGLAFSARLNDSEEAETVYQALKDGSVSEVSVGVYVSTFEEDEESGVTTFTSAEVLELSVITEGNSAFADSKILSVFEAETNDEQVSAASVNPTPTPKEIPMENENTEVADLRVQVEELSRDLAVFQESNRPVVTPDSKFKSFGEVVKGVAAADPEAIEAIEAFAYTGGTSDDTTVAPAWAQPLIKVVDLGRPLTGLFNKQPDPKANVIEYLKLDTNTINVAEQVEEGDDLAYGKISLTSETTGMKTYGGWTDMTRQQIDRSDVNVVDLAYRALAAKYAQVTEARVRTVFLSATGTSATGFDPSDYGSVVEATVRAQTHFTNNGHTPEFIVCSPDVFLELAQADTGTANDFVLDRSNGSVSVRGISATLFGLPVHVLPSGTGVFTFANSNALTIWESGVGRLSDDNIVNLTAAFSLYGYLGVAATDESAIYRALA